MWEKNVFTMVKSCKHLLRSWTAFGVATIWIWLGTPLLPGQEKLTASASSVNNSQTTVSLQVLEIGKPIEQEIKAGDTHTYKIRLEKEQYSRFVVEQKDSDLEITVLNPDSSKLMISDLQLGLFGTEETHLVAPTSGDFIIQIKSFLSNRQNGRYKVEVKELHPASQNDKALFEGRHLLVLVGDLIAQQNKPAFQEAMSKCNLALALQSSVHDQVGEAYTLEFLGTINKNLSELQKSLEYYDQAGRLWQTLNNQGAEARVCLQIGATYADLGEHQKAVDHTERSVSLFHVVGSWKGETTALSNIGFSYDRLGKSEKALEIFEQALKNYQAVGDKLGEGRLLLNIGDVLAHLNKIRQSILSSNNALKILHLINDKLGEATALANLGLRHVDLGETQKALEYFNQAMKKHQEFGNRVGEASTLNSIGVLNWRLNNPQQSLESYEKALTIAKELNHKTLEASIVNNIGNVFWKLGEAQKALEYFQKALKIHLELKNEQQVAIAWGNIGNADLDLGNYQTALDSFEKAHALFHAMKNQLNEAAMMTQIGLVCLKVGNNQKARQCFEESLVIQQAIEDRFGEGITLTKLAILCVEEGEIQKAKQLINQALSLTRLTGDRVQEAEALLTLSKAERREGHLDEALNAAENAVQIIEVERKKATSLSYRASLLGTFQAYYLVLIDILMDYSGEEKQAKTVKAFEISEQMRTRSLLEALTESNSRFSQNTKTPILATERSLIQRISDKSERILRLKSDPKNESFIEELKQEINELTVELENLQAAIRQQNPSYAALTQPQPITLREVQTSLLDQETVLLEFSLGADRSFLWLVTLTKVKGYILPGRDEVEKSALNFIQEISGETDQGNSQIEVEQAGKQLSQMLLGQAATELENKRLLIVPDQKLFFVPFGTLPNPSSLKPRDQLRANSEINPLIVDHEIVILPSASTLMVLRNTVEKGKSGEKNIGVFANPVFSLNQGKLLPQKDNPKPEPNRDTKLSETVFQERLSTTYDEPLPIPGTGEQAKEIQKIAQTEGWKCSIAEGVNATKQAVLDGGLSRFQIIHFATHGHYDDQYPELSGLVLTSIDAAGKPSPGYLLLPDIFRLNLKNAELVVLSACNSALGKQIRGEGIIGMVRAFMYAGAPRVIASLWSVGDKQTKELMKRFYRNLLVKKMRPAAALRTAQKEMWSMPQWRHKWDWAAFQLQGEWK